MAENQGIPRPGPAGGECAARLLTARHEPAMSRLMLQGAILQSPAETLQGQAHP